jgi:hypothetical protein
MLSDSGDKLGRFHVGTQTDDLEPSPFQHHCNQVLADVVQVPGYGADDDLAHRLDASLNQLRL